MVGVFLSFFLCAGLALAQSFVPTPEGDALFNKQDWAGAAREFQSVTERNPQDGRAWFRLASALHRLERYKESATAFQRAAELQFQPPQAMAAMAREYAAAKDSEHAIESLTKAAQAGFGNVSFIDTDPALAALKDRPGFAAARQHVFRNGKPCQTQPEYHQFDFWLGDWDVQVQGQTVARSRIESLADGCIIQENWMPFVGVEGKSWNAYDAATGKWQQHWVSAGVVHEYEGKLEGKAMMLHGHFSLGGPAGEQRMSFTPMEGGKVRQFWEQSTDGGKTWKVAFYGIYIPRETPISDAERQELIDHLKRSQQTFHEAIRGLTPAQAQFKAGADRWSILEVAEHLAQAEQLLFTDAAEGLKLPKGGKSTVSREQLLQAWESRTNKVKSSGEYDPTGRWPDLAAAQRVFDQRRAKTLQFVSETQADLHGRICCGQLDIFQQLLAISAHTLRHVAQIEEVKASPGYPKPPAMQAFRIEQLQAQQQKSGKPWLPFLNVPSMRMGVYGLAAGGEDKQTPHEEDETYYVLRGKAILRVGSEDVPVGPGSVVFVAAHAEHRFHSITEPLEVMVFFAAGKK